MISRGNVERAFEIAKEIDLKPRERLRKQRGDSVLHICAEFGQTECFKKFMELGHPIDILNEVINKKIIFIGRRIAYTYCLQRRMYSDCED